MTAKIAASRKAEILAELDAWTARHNKHLADNGGHYPYCGCNPYQDVIYGLPEFDPSHPRNINVSEQLPQFVLRDGTVISEDNTGTWTVG